MINVSKLKIFAKKPRTICFAPYGFGFGDGDISVRKHVSDGDLRPEIIKAATDIVVDSGIYQKVDDSDDGCGDGRSTLSIFRVDSVTHQPIELHDGRHLRAKVFGGGVVIAASMWRTIAGNPQSGETILGDREFIADQLLKHDIRFGGHTDNRAYDSLSGCGAIDHYPAITANILRYKNRITTTLRLIYGDDFKSSAAAIDGVFESYESLSRNNYYLSNAEGIKTLTLLEDRGAIIKKLVDSHNEVFVVLNTVEDTTLDQRLFDQRLHKIDRSAQVQVFAVDAWRGKMYADAVARIAGEVLGDASQYETRRETAYADFLIRTLAVAATLTAGDLPVYLRQ